MNRYYFIDSSGADTNLQLYSLKQAKLHWADLEKQVRKKQDVSNFHEKCVFIVCTMGLSISQLLGQNNPSPSNRVPSPQRIFNTLVDTHSLDIRLKSEFQEFIDAYDQCRHFGVTEENRRHWQVSQVTFEKTKQYYEFGLKVWEIVINIFRQNSENQLEDLVLEEIENEP